MRCDVRWDEILTCMWALSEHGTSDSIEPTEVIKMRQASNCSLHSFMINQNMINHDTTTTTTTTITTTTTPTPTPTPYSCYHHYHYSHDYNS